MARQTTFSRRQVLQAAAAAAVAPAFVPARLLGADAPSKKITMGFIGVGWMGAGNLNSFLSQSDCQVVAIADVDSQHLAEGVKKVNGQYKREEKGDLKVALPISPGHPRQFLDCIKSRKPTLTPVEVAHRSQTPGHLGYIAAVVGRKLKWDAEKQQIVGDDAATKLLSREMRSPWTL